MSKCLVALTLLFACINTTLALDGSGTEASPWLIRSLADFDEFTANSDYWDDYTRLETDINLTGKSYSAAPIAGSYVESGWNGVRFTGTFDGNGYKVANLTINASGSSHSYLGLFGQIKSSGVIKNLGVENVSITAGDGAVLIGALVGFANTGSAINNCYVTGSVAAGANSVYLGGLTGANNVHINDCYVMVNVTGGTNSDYVGGLTGYNGDRKSVV